MRSYAYLLCVAVASVAMPFAIRGQERVLIVTVCDTHDHPIQGVILSTKGEGAKGPPTDATGKTRIKLAPQTPVGSLVTLLLVQDLFARDLVFMSPWDGGVRVPPFEKESDNFVSIVLVPRTVRQKAESGGALTDSVLSSISGNQPLKRAIKKNPLHE